MFDIIRYDTKKVLNVSASSEEEKANWIYYLDSKIDEVLQKEKEELSKDSNFKDIVKASRKSYRLVQEENLSTENRQQQKQMLLELQKVLSPELIVTSSEQTPEQNNNASTNQPLLRRPSPSPTSLRVRRGFASRDNMSINPALSPTPGNTFPYPLASSAPATFQVKGGFKPPLTPTANIDHLSNQLQTKMEEILKLLKSSKDWKTTKSSQDIEEITSLMNQTLVSLNSLKEKI